MKIYNLFPLVAGKIPDWKEKLNHIVYMGFDYIYINPIFATGYSKNLYAPKSFEDISEQVMDIFSEKDGFEQFEDFIQEAHNLGLKVIYELIFTHTSIDSDLLVEHPEWYKYEDGEVKRFSIKNNSTWIEWGDLVEINNNSQDIETRESLWEYWRQLVYRIVDTGVDIIKLHSSFNLPQNFMKDLISSTKERNPNVEFIGDNLGANFGDMMDLAHAGVDYLFTSFKWWDFKSTWFLEQHYKLKEFVKLISFPENYDTERLAATYNGNENAMKIWYALSALMNTGVMMPIGFEMGSRVKLNDITSFTYELEEKNLDLQEYIRVFNDLKSKFKVFKEENDIFILSQSNKNIFVIKKVSNDREETVLIIANMNFDVKERVYLENIFKIFETDEIKDISPGNKVSIDDKTYELLLNPGEIKILYSKKVN